MAQPPPPLEKMTRTPMSTATLSQWLMNDALIQGICLEQFASIAMFIQPYLSLKKTRWTESKENIFRPVRLR